MAAGVSSRGAMDTVCAKQSGATVEIGGIPVFLQTDDHDFRRLIENRYAGFVNPAVEPSCRFEVHLHPPTGRIPQDDVEISRAGSVWRIERGDFCAEFDARSRRGWVRQSPNPYSLDAAMRIIHSLVLAEESGFLVHAASGIRNGRAFVFSGVSGAGKTTLSRLAPPDATLLTDEISYIRKGASGYDAYGTPFAGELARVGTNIQAPLDALYFLEKGPDNRIVPISEPDAAHALIRNILFFAHDPELVKRVFEAALEFVSRVRVARFVFTPDERAWELIR
ncbi:MAG TPA: hypothetical protein VHX49_08325 [Candidatus Acidoferrales bacterium]|jgi:hypothetical protein|nr:hypothetical protein [Candidatus Acidoferrales bacterium]